MVCPPRHLAAPRQTDLLTLRSLLMIGSSTLFSSSSKGGSQLASGPELTAPSRLALRHPLILDGLCLHVLSSFQRTGFGHPPCHLFRVWGNLPILLTLQGFVNPHPLFFHLRNSLCEATLLRMTPNHHDAYSSGGWSSREGLR